MNTLRPGLTELTERIKRLPVDERGYPVPWFVAWVDGKPEFRAADQTKLIRAVKEKLCWVCGSPLGIHMVFVAGPMCGINRTSAEPPAHYDCALWSAKNCPFLNMPKMVRREDETLNREQLEDTSPGIPISRNPGVAMLWVTRGYQFFPDGNGKLLIQMGEATRVEWYCEGRVATREEVMHSIETGLPYLEELAKMEPAGMRLLEDYKKRFEKWIPQQ